MVSDNLLLMISWEGLLVYLIYLPRVCTCLMCSIALVVQEHRALADCICAGLFYAFCGPVSTGMICDDVVVDFSNPMIPDRMLLFFRTLEVSFASPGK